MLPPSASFEDGNQVKLQHLAEHKSALAGADYALWCLALLWAALAAPAHVGDCNIFVANTSSCFYMGLFTARTGTLFAVRTMTVAAAAFLGASETVLAARNTGDFLASLSRDVLESGQELRGPDKPDIPAGPHRHTPPHLCCCHRPRQGR